jgi:hypothetical protein
MTRQVPPCLSFDEINKLTATFQTVPKPVLDILAEMIAADGDLNVGSFGGGSGSPGVGVSLD